MARSNWKRRLQIAIPVMMALAGMTASAAAADPPDFSGIWKIVGGHPLLMTKDGKVPPLLPEAMKVYEQHMAARKAGDTSFDSTMKCLPPGIPRALLMSRFAIIPEPDKISFLYEWNHRYQPVRLVDKHDKTEDLHYMGDAIGHWDGDTLVSETLYSSDVTLLDDALPHSDDLRVTQRYHLTDSGNTLEDEITIEDPQTFSAPWTTVLEFAKQPQEAELKEDVCVDRLDLEPSIEGLVPRKH